MADFITLSSDSDDDERAIEGIPKSFEDDRKTRFSFGVSFCEPETRQKDAISPMPMIDEFDNFAPSPSPPPAPPMKTPSSVLRRRSLSVTNLSASRQRSHVEQPPISKLCSSLVANNQDDDDDDDDDDDEPLEMRALISPTKKRKKSRIAEVQNEFFGVYCLISRSERPCYKNRCYIGYTVDPNRRIQQHNGGRRKGGAKKTDSRGPWDMVCVVHGFPNHVAALRFEWAWQNPTVSKVLKNRCLKKERKETPFAYQLRIACHLMNSAPFNRFALTFRWLITTEELPFPTACHPPPHTKKRYGRVKKELSLVPSDRNDYVEIGECRQCGSDIEKLWHLVRCVGSCSAHFHARCLAEKCLANETTTPQLFPVKGNCPICGSAFLWGDIVREQRRILKISSKCADEFKSLVVKSGLPHRELTPPL
ncbi:unnamed protein product [Caenorhabditis bovis]|uniref:GIY-YIG domain-containing protein n=1 Tax=Caenorhabditis bovis TaxID=2654633 RepID=A0A8S1F980_9PELO|nr:unnamed protein product [Caenorhabditis bovis]